MEIMMSVVIGVLFAVSVYLILSKSLLRIVLGTVMISHGAHLLLMTVARVKTGAPPILTENISKYTDPLPQALILTSIVISFGVTAMLLVLAYRAYQDHRTDDMDELRGQDYE
jgi:multicomponent Na+:H+ antiporter subunit C